MRVSGYAIQSMGLRGSTLGGAILFASLAGALQPSQVGDFVAWALILIVPGFDLTRAGWELSRVRGVSPLLISGRAVALRWMPAAALLGVAFLVRGGPVSLGGDACNCLLISVLGVLVGRFVPAPWILVPVLWLLSVGIPILTGGRFLDISGAETPRSFSLKLLSSALLAFAMTLADSLHVSWGRFLGRTQT